MTVAGIYAILGKHEVMNMNENQILTGKISKTLISFFIPCWLGMLFQQLYNTVDTMIVGNFVGTNAIAAVGSVSIAVQLVIGICNGIASGAGVLISQHYGAGKFHQVKTDIKNSLCIAGITGILFTIICVFGTEHFVSLMQIPEEITSDAVIYLKIYFCALIPNLIYNFGNAILRAMGDSKRPLYILIVASIVNIILDLVFVLLLGWGVFGVALATGLSQLISALMVFYLLHRQFPDLWKKQAIQQNIYGNIFKIGLPTALESIMYSFSNVLIQISINSFGTAVIASWAIYGKVDCICWMTMTSMGIAVTSFAGQNFGAGNYDRIRKCAVTGSALLTGFLFILVIIFYSIAPVLFRLFTYDPEVVRIGSGMLRFLAPTYFLYVLVEILPGILRGCGDVIIPTIASVIGICLIRVLWLMFVVPAYHSVNTVMLSYVVTWGITAIFYFFYFRYSHWLEKRIRRKH